MAGHRIFEVSKLTHASIVKKIKDHFVKHATTFHWSNVENGFNHNLKCTTKYIGENRLWFIQLPQIVPYAEQSVYVPFEDKIKIRPKYWVYEMHLPEIICVLNEVEGLDDFYIVFKNSAG